MRSSGGVATLAEAAAHPALVLVSGPAAGVVGAALVAKRAGFRDAISFDMGGTSTDVCLIADGRAQVTSERDVGGFPLRLPSVDLHTVGAGGGSIVWTDRGGALRVGHLAEEAAGVVEAERHRPRRHGRAQGAGQRQGSCQARVAATSGAHGRRGVMVSAR